MPSFDYSSRDYATIKSDLLARAARVFPEWTDRDASDFGMLLVDLWAYTADVLHYYIDRAAGEAFISTAQQRESVLALANLLDYVPRGRSSAAGSVTLSNTTTSAVVIAPYTEFIARYNDKTYRLYTESGGTIPASSTGPISLLEGTITVDEEITASATGQPAQSYSLAGEDVVVPSIVVKVYEDGVNPVVYQRVTRLTSADTGDRVFVASVTADGEVTISFGTSLNGFIPPTGATITATYAVSSGSEGNLPANTVIGFGGATPAGVLVSSSTAFTGGVDEESINSLKRSIPTVISAQNRAVTASDFVALALQVDGVAKASVSYAPSLTGASAGNASVTVYAQAARSDYLTTVDTFQTVSAEMQSNVVSVIQPKALLGVTVLAANQVDWVPVNVSITVHVNERFVSNWVKSDVEAAIDELFSFDNVFFGQRLTLGQVYRLVLNVAGVDYCEVTTFSTTTGVNNTILIDPVELPKKGTLALTMVGGITTT